MSNMATNYKIAKNMFTFIFNFDATEGLLSVWTLRFLPEKINKNICLFILHIKKPLQVALFSSLSSEWISISSGVPARVRCSHLAVVLHGWGSTVSLCHMSKHSHESFSCVFTVYTCNNSFLFATMQGELWFLSPPALLLCQEHK